MGLGNPSEQSVMMVAETPSCTGLFSQGCGPIIRVDWDKVRAAEGMMSGNSHLITAITELANGTLVSILDVEQTCQRIWRSVVGEVGKVEGGHEKSSFSWMTLLSLVRK